MAILHSLNSVTLMLHESKREGTSAFTWEAKQRLTGSHVAVTQKDF
jgi:hypothetical protein